MSESFKIEKKIRIAVLTVSDTRTEEADTSGAMIKTMAEAEGIEVGGYRIVRDDKTEIQAAVEEWLKDPKLDAIISTGGTGIAKRDISIEAIMHFFEKEMTGFGELFRYLSFTEDIGTRAMLSRASAGVASDKAIFVLPGSRGAVKLAMGRLVLPELAHIIVELGKHRQARL